MLTNLIYLSGSIITVICIVLCFVLFFKYRSKDKDGNRIELYDTTKEKPWSLGTWIAGVFAAGTGVALIYAPSDIVGQVQNGLNPLESILMITLLNGAPVWALYSIMGIWYMKHMDSKIGKIAAMLSTILGMAISLWTGTNTIAKFIGFDFPGLKFFLAGFMILVAMLSAKFGWLKKMSKLAFGVFIIAALAVIATPNTDFTAYEVTGKVTGEFWKQYFMGATSASWIFWFLSWTPTVARWLAHISKGRTMKEYIAGTMLIPTGLAFVWMIISWKYQDVIMNFNLASNFKAIIPCVIFIVSGMLFMISTLDSDCLVFTEDLEVLSKNKLLRKKTAPYYGIVVLAIFCMFISGLISEPFAFNEYSAMIFVPLIVWSVIECAKLLKSKKVSE